MTRSRVKNDFAIGIDDSADANAITIDSSERVGIGRTPSAWASSLQVTQNGVQGLWTASTGQNSSIGSNLYYDSSVQGRYITDGEAAQYQHFQGTHRWYNAPSGTAGALINGTGNLTQLARLDSDGLKFGSDSAAANALDDYEEGSWTPVLEADTTSPTVTYTSQYGIYTKIGDVVTVSFRVRTSAVSGGSGILRIAGLPFAPSAGDYQTGAVGYSTGWTNAPSAVYTQLNYGYMRLSRYNASGVSLLQTTDLNYSSVNDIIASVTYKT